MSGGFSVVVVASGEPRRSRRAVFAAASGLCLLCAACAISGGGGAQTELFGPWSPMTADVAQPDMSVHASRTMHSLWQQAKWARLFQKREAPQQTAGLSERAFADAAGFNAAQAGPVRFPTELASTRASELEHNAPHYVRELELAAAHPARTQSLEQQATFKPIALARMQSLDYMESKPRSDTRHPGDMDVYQTYEYYPRPEGRGMTDYHGHRLWDEMQKDYRAQHPSATTYPAVPVVFKEDSSGGHPVTNPLSQPVEDIYQGMGYEDNMQPPFGMGMMPEPGASAERQSGGSMKLSAKQGFEMMKREGGSPGSTSHSYRHADWRDRYVPRMNPDHQTFLATPSVARPEYYPGSPPQQVPQDQNVRSMRATGQGAGQNMVIQGRGSSEEEEEVEQERRDLRAKQELIEKEQKQIERELKEEKEAKHKRKAEAKAPSPAQALYRWERAHGVDDPNAYKNVADGQDEERKARDHAQAKALAKQELESRQKAQLWAEEQQMMALRAQRTAGSGAESTHEFNEEITSLKETIRSMAHRQARLTAKTSGLKDEMHQLVQMEKKEMKSFQGRIHGKMEAKVREYREEEQAERAHDQKFKAEISALKREEQQDEAKAKTARTRSSQGASSNKATAERVMRAENARLSSKVRLEMKAEEQRHQRAYKGARQLEQASKADTEQLSSLPSAEYKAKAIKIPEAVLEKADSMVKHRVTTELAQHYESEINSDTDFIFSGSKADESKAAQLAARRGSAGAAATQELASSKPGFGDLHQMEKQVLSQLIEANHQKAEAAKERAEHVKVAAARRLALKKRWYQEEVRKEDAVKAKQLAARKAAQAKAAAAAAAEYAKAHKPVSKMSVQQRALAFVRAFDGGMAPKVAPVSLGASQSSLAAGGPDAGL